LIVVAGLGILVFFGMGRWLVIQDPLVHADAIVVLSGHIPERALEAARFITRATPIKYGFSQPNSPAEVLKTMKSSTWEEDFYNEKILLAQRVPADAIRSWSAPARIRRKR